MLLNSPSRIHGMLSDRKGMRYGTGPGGASGATPNSAEAQAYFNRLVPYPTAPREVIFSTFVDALVDAGMGSAFDFIFINCQDNITNALTNVWSTNYQGRIFQNTSGLTFTANRGFSAGASGHNVDTTFNPTTATGAKYTLNNASVFYWGHSADGAGPIAAQAVYAAAEGAGETILPQLEWLPKWTGGAPDAGLNINCATPVYAANNVGYNRFNIIQRESSTVSKYYGDDNTAILTSSQTSTALPNGSIRFRCAHPTTIMGAGRSLTSQERLDLRSAIQALVTSITGGLP